MSQLEDSRSNPRIPPALQLNMDEIDTDSNDGTTETPTGSSRSGSGRGSKRTTVASLMRLLGRTRERQSDSAFSPDSSSSWTLSDRVTLLDMDPTEPTQDTDERMLARIYSRNSESPSTNGHEIVGTLRSLELEIPELVKELGTDVDTGLDAHVVEGLLRRRGAVETDPVLAELENLAPIECIRSGQSHWVPRSQLVPGDVVILQEGDIAPADVRIVNHSQHLQIHNSALSPRNALDDTIILCYSGTLICQGWLRGIVCATGSATMKARVTQAANAQTPQTQTHAQIRRELFQDFRLLSRDPTAIANVQNSIAQARAAKRYGGFRLPVCADLPTDYLKALKSEAISKHRDLYQVLSKFVRPHLHPDTLTLICDYTNPHYFYMFEQICSIPPSVVLFLPSSDIREFVEYFENVRSDIKWKIVAPEDADLSQISPSHRSHVIIPDCPPKIKRDVVTALYLIGVVYFGGFDVREETMLDGCTLSVCLGRSKICIDRSTVVCMGSPLERLIYSECFLRWLNGEFRQDEMLI